MATVLFKKKYTARDSAPDILDAIHAIATDDHHRLLLWDDNEWLTTKMKEIARLTKILKAKIGNNK